MSALARRSWVLFGAALALRLAAVLLLERPQDVWPEAIWVVSEPAKSIE